MPSRTDDSTLSQQLVPSAGRARRPSIDPPVDPVDPVDDGSRFHLSGPRSPPVDGDGPRLGFSQLTSRGELPAVVAPEQRDRRQILFAAYGVLFVRYNIATFLSAFFGSSATLCTDDGECISGTWQGLIFAAYPLGMALTSLFASQLVRVRVIRVRVRVNPNPFTLTLALTLTLTLTLTRNGHHVPVRLAARVSRRHTPRHHLWTGADLRLQPYP